MFLFSDGVQSENYAFHVSHFVENYKNILPFLTSVNNNLFHGIWFSNIGLLEAKKKNCWGFGSHEILTGEM